MDLATAHVQAADQRSGHRHRAVLLARRQADHVRIQSRRLAADLCDERRRHAMCIASVSAQGKNGTPVWSPRGDLIAFTKITPSYFGVGVMRPDGSGERLLTHGWQDEGPTWAPNGRVHHVHAHVADRAQAAPAAARKSGPSISRDAMSGACSRPAMRPIRHGRP